MPRKPKIRELIAKAKRGDEESFTSVVDRFKPAIKKHVRRLGYDDAYSDLILWLVNAVHRYQPRKRKVKL